MWTIDALLREPAFLNQGFAGVLPGSQGLNLEIGCGYGHFLGDAAPRFPEQGFVGLDIVSKVLRRAERRLAKCPHVAVAKLDALIALRELVAPGTLDHLYIFFPDPWPKDRHAHRRMMQPDKLELFASRLKAGGRLLFVSDDPAYAQQAEEVVATSPRFAATDFPPIEVHTKYERKWLEQDKTIRSLCWQRLAAPDLVDQGSWQALPAQGEIQISDWTDSRQEQLLQHFTPQTWHSGPLTLKLQRQYRAVGPDTGDLLFQGVVAETATLAQRIWLQLTPQGRLFAPEHHPLPYLQRREQVLQAFAAQLQHVA